MLLICQNATVCVEHGLEYFLFYVQKHLAHLTANSGPPMIRDGLLGAPAFLKLTYGTFRTNFSEILIR